MNKRTVTYPLLSVPLLAVVLAGCGLHGVRAAFLQAEGDCYVFRTWGGSDLRLQATKQTRTEPDLQPGDQVQLYYTDDGVVLFITKP